MQFAQPEYPTEQIVQVKNYRRIEELIPTHWSEQYIEANSIKQHLYRTGGQKPQLVLLHGFEECAICWLQIAKTLEQDYDLIMIDARGHGLSDRAASGFSPHQLSEDVASLLRMLKLDRPHILGFSLGADTAIRLAVTYPELVSTIIVSGANDKAPQAENFVNSPGYQAWYQAFVEYLKTLKTQNHEERMISSLRLVPPGVPLPAEDQYVPMVEGYAHIDLKLVIQSDVLWSLVSKKYEETRQLQAQLTCPVLLMYSESFPTSDAEVTLREEPAERPNERIVRFVNAGHLIYREHAEQFIKVVKSFLAS
ncbi:alpha/beta hydrolase [Ktedonosporobacter rubrisoli]|uniref:Alpha/beta hydrolase n=1 Tax=Ktedonosporobacter rubrisoli TaxID=2509675 RepID=A0A4P6JI80_KTERU|nr:alpha/beta hydrolase [Ktedonosporobacter rubrisoli]QBD74758.1 alpha/beta hydrolase [Ktedonosporobacter rubrisoli]